MAKKNTDEKAPTAQGFGESQMFADPKSNQTSYLEALHINGKLIGENFAREQIALLRYEWTDEGIAERNEGKVESAARVTADGFEKACEARADHLSNESMEPWEAPDPMKELADAYVGKGMRPRFLSPVVVEKRARGLRGWEPVRDQNGNLVKLANMVLAQMPEEKARKRQRYYQEMGASQLDSHQSKQREEQERSARDGGGFQPLPSNATVQGRSAVGSAKGGADIDYTPTAKIGLQSVRGEKN